MHGTMNQKNIVMVQKTYENHSIHLAVTSINTLDTV